MALIDEEPGDTAGLARLAELALSAGDAAEVDRLRARRAKMTAAKERYRVLLRGESPGIPASWPDWPGRWAVAPRPADGP